MQSCLRSTKARLFQQIVRLRRRTDATAVLLAHAPRQVELSINRPFASYVGPVQATPAALSADTERRVSPSVSPGSQQHPGIRPPILSTEIEPWIYGLESALSGDLRANSWAKDPSSTAPTREGPSSRPAAGQHLAQYLIAAYRCDDQKFDLLSHLGLVQGKWETVLCIIERMIKDGNVSEVRINTPTSIPILQWKTSRTWDELTSSSFNIEQAELKLESPSIASFASYKDRLPDLGWTYYKGGLGMVWRALGSMILAASRSEGQTRAELMPHVLEIIAILHKHGIIPDAVYQQPRASEPLTLQQPPTLHALSNHILAAISDAEWRASKSSDAIRSKATGSQYDMFGNEMLGTAFRGRVQQLKPEVWLELVLWSCLHGGWIEEGASILKSVRKQENGEWSLINWRDELLQPLETRTTREVSFSSLFRGEQPHKERDVEKTLSSELVFAYIDALVNTVRVGVGERGIALSEVLNSIGGLRAMLESNHFGLGIASWDLIVTRLLESEGVNMEENPGLARRNLMNLFQPFAREVKLENTLGARSQDRLVVPYVFDPSAAALGLYHRLIGTYIKQGDPNGALETFEKLLAFTDTNKRRSMQGFFNSIKVDDELSRSQSNGLPSTRMPTLTRGFTSNISQLADAYPNFYPQLPKALMASLLDLCTNSGAFKFASWLLYSQDVDGPVIPDSTLKDPSLFAPMIRYATAMNDKKLLQTVISAYHGQAKLESSPESTTQMFVTLIQSQITLHRWESIDNMLGQDLDPNHGRWSLKTFALLASEILKLDREEMNGDVTSQDRARDILAKLASNHYGQPRRGWYRANPSVDSVLGYLSSLGAHWFVYCAPLRRMSRPHTVRFTTETFEMLIDGTVHAYGSLKAMQSWKQWSSPIATQSTTPANPYAKANDRGVEKIRPHNYIRGHDYDSKLLSVNIESPSEELEPLLFYGRASPSLSTVSIIIRGAVAERAQMSTEQFAKTEEAYRDLSQWASSALQHLGLDDDEIARELELLKL